MIRLFRARRTINGSGVYLSRPHFLFSAVISHFLCIPFVLCVHFAAAGYSSRRGFLSFIGQLDWLSDISGPQHTLLAGESDELLKCLLFFNRSALVCRVHSDRFAVFDFI